MNHRAVGDSSHIGRHRSTFVERSCGMNATRTSRFLDLRALAALEHMRFSTRRRVEGTFMGYHQSRQLGGAGEFVDFREYIGRRRPPPARLEGAGPHRQGLRPPARRRNQSALHAGDRRQRLDAFRRAQAGETPPVRSSNTCNTWPRRCRT